MVLKGVAERSRSGWEPSGGREMGERIRAHDWAATPLGSIETWPQAVQNAVDLMLAMPQIALLSVGPDLRLLYNDYFAPTLGGKHPDALGRPFAEVWPEVAERLRPTIAAALAGEPQRFVGTEFAIRGRGEEAVPGWFPTTWTPLRDETGRVTGIFIVALEAPPHESDPVNQFVVSFSDAVHRLTDPDAIAQRACRMVTEHLHTERSHWSEVDWQRREFVGKGEYVIGGVNGTSGGFPLDAWEPYTSSVLAGHSVILDDIQGDPGISDDVKAAFAARGMAAVIVVPVMANGALRAHLSASQGSARHWTQDEIALMEGIAGRCWADVERARADEAVREREEKYRTLFEKMGQGYAEIELLRDADGRAVDQLYHTFNPAFERLIGVPVAEARGRKASEVLPELEPWWHEAFDQIVKRGEPERIEYEVASLGRWFEVFAYPQAGDRIMLFYEDVTERKRREHDAVMLSDISRELVGLDNIAETMQRLGEKIGRYFDVTHCMFSEIIHDQETSVVSYGWNAEGTSSLKGTYRMRDFLSDEQLAANNAGELTIVNDTQTDPRVSAETYRALDVQSFIIVPLAHEGQWQFQMSIIDGGPRAWRDDEVALLRDIAERIWMRVERAHTEAALRESEARLRAFADLVPDLLWRTNVTGSEISVTTRWMEYTGQSHADVQDYGWLAAIHPDDIETSRTAFAAAFASGTPLTIQHRIRRRDGIYRWFLVRHVPLRDASGAITQWFGAATDIHEGQMAREDLEVRVTERTADLVAAVEDVRRSEERLHLLLNQMPALLWTTDGNMCLTTLAGASIPTWPVVSGAVDGLQVSDLFAETDLDGTPLAIHEQALRGMPAEFEFRVESHTYEAYVQPLRNTDGRTIGTIGVAHDVTDRTLRKLQEEFIASVSHELQTPLTSIRAGLGLLDTAIGETLGPAERELLAAARRNVERLRLEIGQLLAANQISLGGREIERAVVDLREVVESAVGTLAPLVQEKKQTVDVDMPDHLEVQGDRRLLVQVLVNLLSNAHRHTPPGTRITVSGWFVGDDVRLAVHDTGPGIPSDQLNAIFQRFFRAPGGHREGIGLGLAITRDAVEAQGGRVWVESVLGQGSTFFVSLPHAQDTHSSG